VKGRGGIDGPGPVRGRQFPPVRQQQALRLVPAAFQPAKLCPAPGVATQGSDLASKALQVKDEPAILTDQHRVGRGVPRHDRRDSVAVRERFQAAMILEGAWYLTAKATAAH
jgi:hypothetical protein